jgi:hypothetical protein
LNIVARILRKVPIVDRPGTLTLPGGTALSIKSDQLIVWASVTPSGLPDFPAAAPPFPVVLDTGFNHTFLMAERHLEDWATLDFLVVLIPDDPFSFVAAPGSVPESVQTSLVLLGRSSFLRPPAWHLDYSQKCSSCPHFIRPWQQGIVEIKPHDFVTPTDILAYRKDLLLATTQNGPVV